MKKILKTLPYALIVLALAVAGLKYPTAANIGVIFGILNFIIYGFTLFLTACILATSTDIDSKTDLKSYKKVTEIPKFQFRYSLTWLSLTTLLTFAAGSFFTGFCHLASFIFVVISSIAVGAVKDKVNAELEKRETANVE